MQAAWQKILGEPHEGHAGAMHVLGSHDDVLVRDLGQELQIQRLTELLVNLLNCHSIHGFT